MNHDTDPRKQALTEEERELARIARALPAAMPSPETDRRILDAARAAVGRSPPRRRFAWRWGFGASVAALLVVALVWPMLLPEREPSTEFLSAPAPIDRDESVAPAPAPPAPPPPSEPLSPASAFLRRERAAPLAEPAAAQAEALADRAAEAREPDLAADAAMRQGLSKAMPLPPVETDAELDAEAWLERIRARLAADDEAGARRSLAAFVLRHPEHPLPTDLKPLAE